MRLRAKRARMRPKQKHGEVREAAAFFVTLTVPQILYELQSLHRVASYDS